MRILLDECVPWPMHTLLVGHDCATAQQRGWGGAKNGDLLRLAQGVAAIQPGEFHRLTIP